MFYLAVCDDDLGVFQLDGSILEFQSIGIEEDRVVLFTVGAGELVHDTAVAAVKVVLRVLSEEGEVRHGQICKAEQVCEDNSGKHFKGCGGRKSCSVRDISPDDHVKTAVQCMAFLSECPYNAQGIVCPVVLFFVGQIVKRSLDYTDAIQIHGIKMHRAVLSFSCHAICTHCQGAGKYMTSVVVCVFADQVHAARCKIKARAL